MTQLDTSRREGLARDGQIQRADGAVFLPSARRSFWQTSIFMGLYCAASVLANWTSWAHGITHSMQTSGGADVQEEVWFLAQTPWSLVHGLNPFVNSLINAPVGINLMDNTSMSILGILGAPITFLLGPLATFNILLDLGFVTSAAACFFLVRRFVVWQPAAFVAGLLYGFSPFAVAAGNGHLFLLFTAVPPLVMLVIDETFRSRWRPAWLGGIYLGLLLVAQFFISTEVFASLVVMICIAVVVVALYAVRANWRVEFRRTFAFVASAALVSALGVGYGAWLAVDGPHHIVGPAQSPTALQGLSSDPAALVVPTINQRFTFGEAATGDQLVAVRNQHWQVVVQDAAENGAYIGPPLLALLVMGGIALWRRRVALLCIVMASAALVLSMGSHLHIDGKRTQIPLPFIVLAHLPLLKSGVAARYSLFFWLFAALLLALILDAVHRSIGNRTSSFASARALTACWGTAAIALAPLTPSWPYTGAPWSTPAWFTSSARSLPIGTGVLVYPMSEPGEASAMVWQADAHLTFQMPGGYAVFASKGGAASFSGPPSSTQMALSLCSGGNTVPLAPQAVRRQLAAWHVKTIAVVTKARGAGCARDLFERAIGVPVARGDVLVWGIGNNLKGARETSG